MAATITWPGLRHATSGFEFALAKQGQHLLQSSMASGKRWSRDEVLIVLNLYHKLPFGQFHQRQPVVIDLAARLARTPSSVAMKLSNLASLDPSLKLRGIKGLEGASNLDREVWEEFHENPADFVPLSQERFDALFVKTETETTEVVPGEGIHAIKNPPSNETEVNIMTQKRRGQNYFRDIVINNFGGRCGVTGLPIRELLVASHILPWHAYKAERLNIRNGICLNSLHDAAFDRHLISFDDNFRLILSRRLKSLLPEKSVRSHFEEFEGETLTLHEEGLAPDQSFLRIHRKNLVV